MRRKVCRHSSGGLILTYSVAEQMTELLPTILQYISLREALATNGPPAKPENSDDIGVSTTSGDVPLSLNAENTSRARGTRDLLARIAWLTRENIRASEEKVAIATAAYDSVRAALNI
jgi:hypothetical protein